MFSPRDPRLTRATTVRTLQYIPSVDPRHPTETTYDLAGEDHDRVRVVHRYADTAVHLLARRSGALDEIGMDLGGQRLTMRRVTE